MKTIIIPFLALFTLPAAFGSEDFKCEANYETSGKTMQVHPLSPGAIAEGQPLEYLVVIREGEKELFRGVVDARNEDVMLSFRSRRGQARLRGMIYLDELDQTWMNLNGEQLEFDCNPKE